MEKKVMEAMEKVRKSGVCNMHDGVCVRGALWDQCGISVNRNEFRKVFEAFVDYNKNGGKK